MTLRTLPGAARAVVLERDASGLAQEPVLITANFTDPFWHIRYLTLIEYIGFVR